MRFKKDILDIEELSAECRRRGIAAHKTYLEKFSEVPGAPSNIKRSYGDKYVTWDKFIRIGCEHDSPESLRKLGIFHY